jgi:hypothetical protein
MAGLIQLVRAVYPAAYLAFDGKWQVLRERGGRPVGCKCKDPAAAWKSAADRLREGRPGPGRRKRKPA